MSETNEQTYSKQIVYTAQVKSTIEVEGSTRDLTVIIPVPNGNLWIADCPRARNLTLINRNGKKIKQSDNLCSSTISYAVGYDTEILALCISEKTVFSLSSEGKKLENFYESSRYFPNGICVTKDLSVILSLKSETSSYDSDTKVIKIGRKGEVIWTVQTDTNGGLMFARPMQAIELDNGNIIVVDNYGIGGCKVVGLNREGDVLFKNEVQVDRMPFYIDRITQKDNRLFAIYQKKNKILLLNASGAEIRCLMDERCINPKTITVDYEGNILLGCRYGTIHIIEYQETVVTGHVINEFSLQGDSEEIALLHQKHDELYTWRNKSNVVQVTTLDGKITKTVYLKPALSRAIYIQSLSISPVDGSFWYALSTGRIQHVGLNNEKLHCITTYEGRKKVPMALRVSQNELLIAGLISGNKIIVLDMNGKEIRDIEHDNIVMDEPPFHIDQCCKTGNFAFPCGSHSICVTNENFEHIYTLFGETMLLADGKIRNTGYKCTRKFQPWFYCYDMDGNLVVSDENSLSVLLFSTDGHFIETITREIEWQRRPCGVGPNSDGTLWIAHYNGDIKQIRYKRADTKTLRKKKQKKTFAEVDMQDIRELRKSKETIAEMVKEEETMTPVKRRKRKLSTGKIGEQSRKASTTSIKGRRGRRTRKHDVEKNKKDT